GSDEAEALLRVEPLHSALCHAFPSLSNTGFGGLPGTRPTGPVPSRCTSESPQVEEQSTAPATSILRACTFSSQRTQKLRPVSVNHVHGAHNSARAYKAP